MELLCGQKYKAVFVLSSSGVCFIQAAPMNNRVLFRIMSPVR